MTQLRVGCIQLNAGSDVSANLQAAAVGVRKAAEQGARLICLPEYCALLDGSGRVMREGSPPEAEHSALPEFASLAQETDAWLLIGSLTVKLDADRMENRSYLTANTCEAVARKY